MRYSRLQPTFRRHTVCRIKSYEFDYCSVAQTSEEIESALFYVFVPPYVSRRLYRISVFTEGFGMIGNHLFRRRRCFVISGNNIVNLGIA